MAVPIQLRRGTQTAWATANPLLAAGEIGAETNTGRYKIGDGVTLWNSLGYSSGSVGPQGPVGPGVIPGQDAEEPETAWMIPGPVGPVGPIGSLAFGRGGTITDPVAARDYMVWVAPFSCTVTNVRGHRKGGTGATVNARRNQASAHLASDLSLTTADVWTDGGAVQNTAYVAGDDLEIQLKSITGAVTEIAIQVDFTRP